MWESSRFSEGFEVHINEDEQSASEGVRSDAFDIADAFLRGRMQGCQRSSRILKVAPHCGSESTLTHARATRLRHG